ncbi:MAG: hypothetical protein QOJ64_3872 [Acidobacteriota bacterium]|jgi:hypothetical protein|nr:hypothetical protein [Acidobacteriota bacterium]
MKLYAYCVTEELPAGSVDSMPGIDGAQSFLIQSGNLAAVVSAVDVERIDVTREHVLGHERVVRGLLSMTTPLPFRFGTVVDEPELRSYLESHHSSILSQLERVRGCVEMSVKVIWDLERIKREASEMEEAEDPHGQHQATNQSGTAFLAAKKREIEGASLLKERGEAVATWLMECLGDSVRDAVMNVQPSQPLVLAAAHLVERGQLEEYRAALGSAREARNELHFLTSGPWPPYSFTNINS